MHEQFNPIREVYSIVLHVWPTTTKKYLVSSISFVSFLLFILLQTTSHAQKAYSPTIADPVADAWRWHAYKQVEGKKYNCMLEDQSGNIWIGHRTGLYRYNGLDWQTFPAIDTLNISVTALFETEEGDILAGSETAIYQFDNEIWTKIFDLSIFEKTRCAALGQSPDGAIWIGLDDGAIRLTKSSSAYSIINQQKEHVYSSIKYAQTIQNAILPTNTQIAKLFNYFNVYKPKDIVSGDFYWMSEDKNEQDEFFFVMADCTGHGVPGAFMSVIGSQLLSRIINERKIYSPAQILEELDANLRTVLMPEESQNNDGMDIMICKFKKANNNEYLVTFAGAKSACIEYKSKTKSCIVHKGTARKIGGVRRSKQNLAFQEQSILLSERDFIIMYTDGIVDLAYADRKRFGTTNLIQFLISINELSVQEKEKSINDLIDTFLKVSNQRDDIAIIGINPFV